MKFLLAITALLLFALQVNSQPTIDWVRNVNYSMEDDGEILKTDNNGNVIITGYAYMVNSYVDIITLKFNNDGDLLWSQIFNGPANLQDRPTSMVLDDSNNIYITGGSDGIGTSCDFVTIKYNPNGIQQWTKRYTSPGNHSDFALNISIDNSDKIYITGRAELGSQIYNIVTIVYNINGQELLNFSFQASSEYQLCKNYIDNNQNIYITYTDNSHWTYDDVCISKFNKYGALKWNKTYNGTGNFVDYATSLLTDASGNIYVGGVTNIDYCIVDYFILKLDSLGNNMVFKKFNYTSGCLYSSCKLFFDNQNNIILTGTATNPDSYYIIKTDLYLDSIWTRKYQEAQFANFCCGTILDNQNNIYVTGSFWKPVENSYDIATVKYNSNGNLIWHITYDGTPSLDDFASSISLYDNKIYIGGSNYSSVNNKDILILKYSQPIGIHPISSEVPEKFSLSQNYPNPFNPVTKIKFALPPSPQGEGLGVRVIIYDILGREVQTLVNETLQPGTYEVEYDGTNFSSGIYYYTLSVRQAGSSTGDYSETKKMILIK